MARTSCWTLAKILDGSHPVYDSQHQVGNLNGCLGCGRV